MAHFAPEWWLTFTGIIINPRGLKMGSITQRLLPRTNQASIEQRIKNKNYEIALDAGQLSNPKSAT